MKNNTLLMIPGPIEFEPDVLSAISDRTLSHVSPEFINIFGQALEQMRKLFLSSHGQPFVLSGSGTLAMDFTAANLVEPGDQVLVINTGYFGDRMVEILKRYEADVTQIKPPSGDHPALEDVEKHLAQKKFKFMMITQVDTSTEVLTDVRGLSNLARKVGVLVVVDGVCSLAAEELNMDEWGVDIAFTASQKAVGVPPGLALIMVGQEAMKVFRSRKNPIPNYYCDFNNWLPVMLGYEARKPVYFGTPAVNLICGLNVSLGQILSEGIAPRISRHCCVSKACKQAINSLGLRQIPKHESYAAHSMTAPRIPSGINPAAFLSSVKKHGVVLAGGLLPPIQAEYFRIGHMGSVNMGDILTVIGAIELSLAECGYKVEPGIGVRSVIEVFKSG